MHPAAPGTRFAFGRNWQDFLATLSEEQIEAAKSSLRKLFGMESLRGLRFLDAGCGSGLFSLAALRLGAEEVVSLDVDPECIRCAEQLNIRFGPYPNWKAIQGSVLDATFLGSLGAFEIVYSWGVLHHTGALWQGLENVTIPVRPGGMLCISIYNDQGTLSNLWLVIKRLYNRASPALQLAMSAAYFSVSLITNIINTVLSRQWSRFGNLVTAPRGMNLWNDAIDWMGGYPFEVASPEQLFRFCRDRQFALREMFLKRGHGCNEMVFVKRA